VLVFSLAFAMMLEIAAAALRSGFLPDDTVTLWQSDRGGDGEMSIEDRLGVSVDPVPRDGDHGIRWRRRERLRGAAAHCCSG